MPDVITCGNFIFVAWWQQDMLAAFAGIGAGNAHVGHPTLIDVHRDTDQRACRHLHNHRNVAQVDQ